MIRPAPHTQGSVDGLCGLYALLNYIGEFECFADGQASKAHNAFWYLLEAMDAEGLLSPYHIWYGLETAHLKRIIDRVTTDFELPVSSFRISSALKILKLSTFEEAAPHLLKDGGAAVVGLDGGNHWVLVDGQSGKSLKVRDSAKPQRQRFGKSTLSNISTDGLVLTPHDSRVASILRGS